MAIIDAAAIPFSVPAIVLSLLISSLFLKIFTQFWRFRHIPGPFQAKLTNFWLSWKFWTRESFLDISLDLTKRYGPVVQYGPNRVMFSDVSAVGVIFNTKDALPKVCVLLLLPASHSKRKKKKEKVPLNKKRLIALTRPTHTTLQPQ